VNISRQMLFIMVLLV